MKEKTKQRAAIASEALSILLFAYPLGVFIGLLGLLGRWLGLLRVLHLERLKCIETIPKKILVFNHPSVFDPFFGAMLLAWYYALHPLKHAPLIVADRLNFYDSWWFWPFRSVMIPVDRNSDKKKASSLLRIRNAVECGRPLMIFPEGGRTFKGNGDEFLFSRKGNKIRFLQEGIGLLVRRTGATIIPIGIAGSDKAFPNSKEKLFNTPNPREKIAISIGEPLLFETKTPREKVTQTIASTLLSLIDEASDHLSG